MNKNFYTNYYSQRISKNQQEAAFAYFRRFQFRYATETVLDLQANQSTDRIGAFVCKEN